MICLLYQYYKTVSVSLSFYPTFNGRKIASMMSRGLHRVPIIDISTNEIVRIVTRSDVTIFLFNNLTRLGNRVLDAVSTIRNSLTPVISIHQSAPLIEALRLMNDNNISAIPICDDHGKLADNFSCSDLRQILQESSSSSDFMSTAISVWMHCIRMRQNRTSFDKNEMEFSSEWEGYETKVCTLDMTICKCCIMKRLKALVISLNGFSISLLMIFFGGGGMKLYKAFPIVNTSFFLLF